MLKYKLNLKDIINNIGSILLPIGEIITPISDQETLIKNNIKSDDVNQIIDFEKVKIEPVYYTNIVTDEFNQPITTDNGDFIIVNETTISLLSSIQFLPNFYLNNNWSEGGTKLSLLGFTEDDVKNRRNRLSKSFLRLSFYDNNNLTTQNLLYYSNVFVDSGRIYGDYISGVQFNDLSLRFSVENPKIYNLNKKYEGFNIYLFKDDIIKNETKTIYLKFEYNNAINGTTSLFLKNKPDNSNGYTLNELKNNMFFEIKIKYDAILKKYIYWVDGNAYNKNIMINLYQAKVK